MLRQQSMSCARTKQDVASAHTRKTKARMLYCAKGTCAHVLSYQ